MCLIEPLSLTTMWLLSSIDITISLYFPTFISHHNLITKSPSLIFHDLQSVRTTILSKNCRLLVYCLEIRTWKYQVQPSAQFNLFRIHLLRIITDYLAQNPLAPYNRSNSWKQSSVCPKVTSQKKLIWLKEGRKSKITILEIKRSCQLMSALNLY